MVHLIGLLEHARGQLLLPLSERVNVRRARIHRLSHAALSLPVGRRAKSMALSVSIVVDWGSLHVATPKDTGL